MGVFSSVPSNIPNLKKKIAENVSKALKLQGYE